ncbi:hypothetical protein [Planomonospora sp. ID67723]|nr:hypothetical protein [Planomonospora sp. ID67723]
MTRPYCCSVAEFEGDNAHADDCPETVDDGLFPAPETRHERGPLL